MDREEKARIMALAKSLANSLTDEQAAKMQPLLVILAGGEENLQKFMNLLTEAEKTYLLGKSRH